MLYQDRISPDSEIRYPRINRLLNRLVRKCRLTHASDTCDGCQGFTRCHRNAGEPISIDVMQPGAEHEQSRIEVI